MRFKKDKLSSAGTSLLFYLSLAHLCAPSWTSTALNTDAFVVSLFEEARHIYHSLKTTPTGPKMQLEEFETAFVTMAVSVSLQQLFYAIHDPPFGTKYVSF
jgi:hypothetical protein